MKNNYKSWDLNIEDFPSNGDIAEQLKFLIRFVILAPSGHNGQPWNFFINKNTISLFVNEERSLPVSDPERRQLLIGFGCAIENLLIAADFYNFSYDIIYFPDSNNSNLVANITFTKKE